MGFFNDLGSFLNEVQQVTHEVDGFKQEVGSTIKTTVTDIATQASAVRDDVTTQVADVTQTVTSTKDDIAQELSGNTQ